jgi:hypothetical protein
MFRKFVSILGLLLMFCVGYSYNLQDGDDVIIVKGSSGGGTEKDCSSCMSASINGHNFTLAITDNIGQVLIEITTFSGVTINSTSTQTPTGYQCYISAVGNYVVTITLSNGDEYYGKFLIE